MVIATPLLSNTYPLQGPLRMLRLNPPTYTPHTRQHPQAHSPASRLRSGNELSPEVSFSLLKTNLKCLAEYMRSTIQNSPRGKDKWDAILRQINHYVTTIINYNDQCGEFNKMIPK
jgi:hypothetical protein